MNKNIRIELRQLEKTMTSWKNRRMAEGNKKNK